MTDNDIFDTPPPPTFRSAIVEWVMTHKKASAAIVGGLLVFGIAASSDGVRESDIHTEAAAAEPATEIGEADSVTAPPEATTTTAAPPTTPQRERFKSYFHETRNWIYDQPGWSASDKTQTLDSLDDMTAVFDSLLNTQCEQFDDGISGSSVSDHWVRFIEEMVNDPAIQLLGRSFQSAFGSDIGANMAAACPTHLDEWREIVAVLESVL